jgi:hypothetical protein
VIFVGYLLSELVNRGEGLLVLVEELENLIKELIDIWVNPVTILKLNNEVQHSNVGHDFMAALT